MLFFYRKKVHLTIVLTLFVFSISIFSQTNANSTFLEKTQNEKAQLHIETTNKIIELKNNVSNSNARLQVYKVLSIIFLSILSCFLFLIYKKQKNRKPKYVHLEEQLNIETKKYYLLEQNFLIIEKFEKSFNCRLETIINLIKVFKSSLNGNQQMLINEIEAISDFVETSRNHYKKAREIINTLK